MLGTIRKHSQAMWWVIIAVIIVSFVVFFTPDAKWGGGGRENYGTLFGRPVSHAEINQAAREARLAFFFRYRQWPDSPQISRMVGFDLDMEARRQLVLFEAIRRQHIEVSDALVADQIKSIFRDPKEPAKFDPQNYYGFVQRELAPQGLTQHDFESFLRHELGRMHLASVHGMSGRLITSLAAESFFRRENEQVLTEAVFFHDTNFTASVVIETNALMQFFTNQLAQYRIPERMQVGYVFFPISNHLAAADFVMASDTNLAAKIDAEFTRRGTNALSGPDGKARTPDEVKKSIRDEIRKFHAATNAIALATAFANELYRMQPLAGTNLDRLAGQKGLAVLDSGPFDRLDGPVAFAAPRQFTDVAFALTADAPISPTVHSSEGTYLLSLRRKLDSAAPAFEAVKDKVTADFRRSQSHELCMQAARAALVRATNALAQGRSFKDAVAAEKSDYVDVPALSRRLRQMAPLDDRGAELQHYREEAFRLGKGKVSQPATTFSGAYFFHVKDVQAASEQKVREDLPAFTDQWRDNRVGYAFEEWLNREAELSGVLAGRRAEPKEKAQ
jgi:hypothetical protein